MLKYEAKKRPEIAKLMDNCTSMSDDEIDNSQVPLPWFKIALKKYKSQQIYEQMLANAPELETIEPDANSVSGSIYRFEGEDCYIPSWCGPSKLKLSNGELFFIQDDNKKLWLGTNLYTSNLNYFNNCSLVMKTTRLEYKKMCDEELSKKYSGNTNTTPVRTSGITIRRHY